MPPTVHYNNRGYEAAYDPASDTCTVVMRGLAMPNGKIVVRGGPNHPDDKPVARLCVPHYSVAFADLSPRARIVWELGDAIRDTFHDALADRRDLLGAPLFRHKPADDTQRRYFAAAYDAAQKVRSNADILGVDRLVFSVNPSFFALVDCFARDRSGVFWLMFCASNEPDGRASRNLSLAAYILEAGEYVPSSATVRIGVWTLAQTGASFTEVQNDRIAARDAVIASLASAPF